MTLTPRGLGVSSDFWDRKQLEYKESFGRAWLTFNHLENLHSILQKKQHSSDLKNKHTQTQTHRKLRNLFLSHCSILTAEKLDSMIICSIDIMKSSQSLTHEHMSLVLHLKSQPSWYLLLNKHTALGLFSQPNHTLPKHDNHECSNHNLWKYRNMTLYSLRQVFGQTDEWFWCLVWRWLLDWQEPDYSQKETLKPCRTINTHSMTATDHTDTCIWTNL